MFLRRVRVGDLGLGFRLGLGLGLELGIGFRKWVPIRNIIGVFFRWRCWSTYSDDVWATSKRL